MAFTREALELYRMMFLIRNVEERIRTEYASRNIRMAVHLSIGQEAVAAGVLTAALPEDCCISTHRCHAHYLAKGGDLGAMIDEFYSLESGCSRGRGGSMHLFDNAVNMWGSGAIVGGGIPIAVGIGLALKQRNAQGVSIGFSGDGGTDEGSFYESLNLAALLQLPVLFVVENNGYATLTRQTSRQAAPYVLTKARAFGVDGITVDGNDALGVHRETRDLLHSIRTHHKPMLLEAITYRMGAHVGPGEDFGDGRRPEAEGQMWRGRDPLTLLKVRLVKVPAIARSVADIERETLVQIDAAFGNAKQGFAAVNAIANLPAPAPSDPSKV